MLNPNPSTLCCDQNMKAWEMRQVPCPGSCPLDFHSSSSTFLLEAPSVGTLTPIIFCPNSLKDQLRFCASIPSEFCGSMCMVLVISFPVLKIMKCGKCKRFHSPANFSSNGFGWRCPRPCYMILCHAGFDPSTSNINITWEIVRNAQSRVLLQNFHIGNWRNIALHCTLTHCIENAT